MPCAGFDVDANVVVLQRLARRWTDRRDDDSLEPVAHGVAEAQLLGHPQDVDHLMGRGEQGDVEFTGGQAAQVRFQRLRVEREVVAVDLHGSHGGAAGLEPGGEAHVRLAVLLHADGLVRHRDAAVDERQHFAPGVRLGSAVLRRQAPFAEHCQRLRAADDRRHIAERVEKPLPVDMAFDLRDQVSRADAGHQNHDVDLPGDESVGEIDGVGIRVETDFAERRRDVRHAAEALDEPRHFLGPATLKGRDPQSAEVRRAVGHRVSYLPAGLAAACSWPDRASDERRG